MADLARNNSTHMHSKSWILAIVTLLVFQTGYTQDKQVQKIQEAQAVLNDFMEMKEDIPAELLHITQGIILVPKLINAGFVVGGKRGKGIAMVKTEDGSWSDPSFVTLTAGSVGFQAGIQSIDLVLIFRDKKTLMDIGKGSFTLGGDVAVAAGPVGRSGSAATDYKMEAEVYSYSKSKGLFAGISISGSAIEIDAKANEAYYGRPVTANELFSQKTTKKAGVREIRESLEELDDEADVQYN